MNAFSRLHYIGVLIFTCIVHASSIFAQSSTNFPDKPSTHGMLLFGGIHDKAIYASHLPMFHSPHDYQVLLELTIPDSVQALYKASVKKFPKQTVYTIEPEVFVLPEMLQKPRPFKIQLYRGHFERGGTKIAENITAHIRTILHFRKFDPAATRPQGADFLIFGTEKEAFLAHAITAKPDFDQILSLKPHTPLSTLHSGTTTPCTVERASNKPLSTQQKISLRFGTSTKATLKVEKSLYCEFGDLK